MIFLDFAGYIIGLVILLNHAMFTCLSIVYCDSCLFSSDFRNVSSIGAFVRFLAFHFAGSYVNLVVLCV